MVSRADIQDFVDRIVDRFRPTRVILFGSAARGRVTPDSDVDLLVVMPYRGSSARAATRIRLACPRSFPVDLIVRTAQEVRKGVQAGDSFVCEVVDNGIVLHESRRARVGR